MLGKLVNLLVWLLVAWWIVIVGWDEPLKYRVMSPEAKEAEEKAILPPPSATPRPPDYRQWATPGRKGTTLGNSPINGHGVTATPRR